MEYESRDFKEKIIKRWKKKYINQFYSNNHTNLIVSAVLLCLQSLAIVFLSYMMQQILDAAISSNTNKLLSMLIYAVIFLIAYMFVGFLLREIRNQFIMKGIRQYKKFVYERIISKKINAFNAEKTGSYISALTNDIAGVGGGYLHNIFSIIGLVPAIAGALFMMLYYSPKLTVITLGFSIFPILISGMLGDKVIKASQEMSYSGEHFVSTLKDLLGGFTVIKSFKAEKDTIRIFDKQNQNLELISNKKRKIEELISLVSGAASFIAQIGTYIVGGYFVIKGEITAGVVLAFIQLSEGLLSSVFGLPGLIATMQAGLKLVDKLILLVETSYKEGGNKELLNIGAGIEMKDISFSYDSLNDVLKNINLHLEAEKSYAIIGASGSGKTTLLNLLMGGYSDYKGSILMNGIELRDIKLESLYEIISIIQQNVFIFDSTIEDNITMFKTFDQDKIRKAVEKAGLTNVIKEKGQDYKCGENGSGLSGGERQRISIARSLLRNTPVLLVDEATASLDSSISFLVEDAILNMKELTRIVITHKLDENLLRKYDRLIVLSEGVIREEGTYEELIKQKGYFYSLYNVSNCEGVQ